MSVRACARPRARVHVCLVKLIDLLFAVVQTLTKYKYKVLSIIGQTHALLKKDRHSLNLSGALKSSESFCEHAQSGAELQNEMANGNNNKIWNWLRPCRNVVLLSETGSVCTWLLTSGFCHTIANWELNRIFLQVALASLTQPICDQNPFPFSPSLNRQNKMCHFSFVFFFSTVRSSKAHNRG